MIAPKITYTVVAEGHRKFLCESEKGGRVKKLSYRAIEILLAIRFRCDSLGLGGSWCPGSLYGTSDYSDELCRFVNINGGGDASILRSLLKKGLLKQDRTDLKYHFISITEDGRLAIEKAREAGDWEPTAIDKATGGL